MLLPFTDPERMPETVGEEKDPEAIAVLWLIVKVALTDPLELIMAPLQTPARLGSGVLRGSLKDWDWLSEAGLIGSDLRL